MKIELGKESLYVDQYNAELLEPIARANSRSKVFTCGEVPFSGGDIWTAYELSWLNQKGLPQVAIAEFYFPYNTHAIVESKSFKYYLNSLNQTVFESKVNVKNILERDLSQAAGGQVKVSLIPIDKFNVPAILPGVCVDGIDAQIDRYQPDSSLLQVNDSISVVGQAMYSHLLKSNCPVTGQPDWATVWVEYSGKKIFQESFLKYVVSYRQHQDFHENCVEKIFIDIQQECKPDQLSVYARYTRRGGLDINPYRTNTGKRYPFVRVARQ